MQASGGMRLAVRATVDLAPLRGPAEVCVNALLYNLKHLA